MPFEKLESFMLNSAKERGISGYSVVIHKDGKELYKKSYTAPWAGNTFNSGSRHWIYSMTKPITALMGVILLEKGVIRLNDKLSDYFPEYTEMNINENGTIRKANNKILIEHLFNMTAGFGYDIFSPLFQSLDADATTAKVIQKLAEIPLDFEPGTAFQYGFCFDVLAAVYEKATGIKLSELYQKYIFEKLGMNRTSFEFTDDVLPMYYVDNTKQIQSFGNKNCYVLTDGFESGGAGLLSTVDDYIKFADLLSNKGVLPNGERLLSESSAKLFYQHYLDDNTLTRLGPFYKKGYSYGFGCRTLVSKEYGAISPLGEFGWDGAAGSYVLMDTENCLSIVYMQDLLFEDEIYEVIHPKIRDLAYKEILNMEEDIVCLGQETA